MSDDLTRLPGQPYADDGPVFREPWEAQAFAMTLSLSEKGVFTWSEWAQALGVQIAAAQRMGDADLGNTYYRHWLTALEALVVTKGVSSSEELAQHRQGWRTAADRTPHGHAIELRASDLAYFDSLATR